jgi:hypothetical protein
MKDPETGINLKGLFGEGIVYGDYKVAKKSLDKDLSRRLVCAYGAALSLAGEVVTKFAVHTDNLTIKDAIAITGLVSLVRIIGAQERIYESRSEIFVATHKAIDLAEKYEQPVPGWALDPFGDIDNQDDQQAAMDLAPTQ